MRLSHRLFLCVFAALGALPPCSGRESGFEMLFDAQDLSRRMRPERHSDGKVGATRRAASLYDILPADTSKFHPKPVGEGNGSRIVCQGHALSHDFLNDGLGLEVDKESVKKNKYKDIQDFVLETAGRIFLQDHNDNVWFRNTRIQELSQTAVQ